MCTRCFCSALQAPIFFVVLGTLALHSSHRNGHKCQRGCSPSASADHNAARTPMRPRPLYIPSVTKDHKVPPRGPCASRQSQPVTNAHGPQPKRFPPATRGHRVPSQPLPQRILPITSVQVSVRHNGSQGARGAAARTRHASNNQSQLPTRPLPPRCPFVTKDH